MSETETLNRLLLLNEQVVKTLEELKVEAKETNQTVARLSEKVLEHTMMLAQGNDRFRHQDDKIEKLKGQMETDYVRKETVKAYLIGTAVASGGGVALLVKLFS